MKQHGVIPATVWSSPRPAGVASSGLKAGPAGIAAHCRIIMKQDDWRKNDGLRHQANSLFPEHVAFAETLHHLVANPTQFNAQKSVEQLPEIWAELPLDSYLVEIVLKCHVAAPCFLNPLVLWDWWGGGRKAESSQCKKCVWARIIQERFQSLENLMPVPLRSFKE